MDSIEARFGNHPMLAILRDVQNANLNQSKIIELRDLISNELDDTLATILDPLRAAETVIEKGEDYLLSKLQDIGIPTKLYRKIDSLADAGIDYVVGETYEEVRKYVSEITLPDIITNNACSDYVQ